MIFNWKREENKDYWMHVKDFVKKTIVQKIQSKLMGGFFLKKKTWIHIFVLQIFKFKFNNFESLHFKPKSIYANELCFLYSSTNISRRRTTTSHRPCVQRQRRTFHQSLVRSQSPRATVTLRLNITENSAIRWNKYRSVYTVVVFLWSCWIDNGIERSWLELFVCLASVSIDFRRCNISSLSLQ